MVWSLVDALRAQDDTEEAAFTPGNAPLTDRHSRSTSYSLRQDASGDTDSFAPLQGGHNVTGIAGHSTGLTFRHRDRGKNQPRPPTNVGARRGCANEQIYFTSSADIGDLIDHLSSDLDASRGRIDILPHMREESRLTGMASQPAVGQFEDAPSPQRLGSTVPRRRVDPYGVLPRRQLFASPNQLQDIRSTGEMAPGGPGASASAPSFASSGSLMPGRTVEDRLQALLDRLREGGLREG